MRVFEVFNSINGEVGIFPQGTMTTFVRFAGCNLKCPWCDTARTQDPASGMAWTAQELAEKVKERLNQHRTRQLLLTGGEPLVQPTGQLEDLLSMLPIETSISVETNGSLAPSLDMVGKVNCWIVDVKPPSSGQLSFKPSGLAMNFPDAFTWVKFPVESIEDVAWTIQYMISLEEELEWRPLGFAYGVLKGQGLTWKRVLGALEQAEVDWNLVRCNVQIHKVMEVA